MSASTKAAPAAIASMTNANRFSGIVLDLTGHGAIADGTHERHNMAFSDVPAPIRDSLSTYCDPSYYERAVSR
jgi:hypothetical protein